MGSRRSNKNAETSRLRLLIVIAATVAGLFLFGAGQYVVLDYLRLGWTILAPQLAPDVLLPALVFFLLYAAFAALPLPGAALLSLAVGVGFGMLWGTVLVSFASSLGAVAAFLISRSLLRDLVQRKFGGTLRAINHGVEAEGPFYLFALRLVPLVPFFIVNLAMGLTPMRPLTFYLVSQLSMLPATMVYVNAGSQIAKIDSWSDVFSPALIIAFSLVGFLPLISKKLLRSLRVKKRMKRYEKPEKFDRNLVVIGAGSAGLVTAYVAAALKAKVTLIEKHKMGGDCLNTGCVPSKALIRSAKFFADVRRAERFGARGARAHFEFADVMERVQRIIKTIEPHDSVERYTSLGVECIEGAAKITSPYTVEVNGKTLTTRSIVIATGARPFVPSIPGIQDVGYVTSDTVWELRDLPKRLLVLGGGPIGCELAQAFTRFGSRVIQIEAGPRILSREDPEVSAMVSERFRSEGIDVRVDHRPKAFRVENGQNLLICQHWGQEVRIRFDKLLVAAGRVANTTGYGLEDLGIGLRDNGTIEVNEYLQTSYPNIYACGDVAGPFQFTHTASHQARFAASNALFGGVKKFKVDYSVIPWTTFTDPEVARVGINEQEAKRRGIAYEVTTYNVHDLDRAITDEEAHGIVKVLTVPNKDKILGVTIVAAHAGDLIAEYVLAMRQRVGLKKILKTVHVYPTFAEANKYAAAGWRKAHAPQTLLRWLERYHGWRRGRASDSEQLGNEAAIEPGSD